MKQRPWPIVLLAACQIVAPIWSVLVNAHVYQMSVSAYLQTIWVTQPLWSLASFFLLVPLAGVAIYWMKPWSYPIFLVIMAYVSIDNYFTWRSSGDLVTVGTVLVVYALNILLVGYFLIPAVRTVYFNPRVRWWESKPRFEVRAELTLELVDRKEPATPQAAPVSATLFDLSEGGAFVETLQEVSVGAKVRLRFALLGQSHEVEGRVVYRRPSGLVGYGVQFVFASAEEKARFRRLARGLDFLGLPRRPERVQKWADFCAWLRRAAQGKDWLPELPRAPGA